ncbi:MAG: bifunctional [glutamate--ammonia ligase]-adenylyl-L-tyrosine phosphorylase/[glutamate--ammonia-ligase] adenylyltransferase, partial [Pontixanthobacter sp.]
MGDDTAFPRTNIDDWQDGDWQDGDWQDGDWAGALRRVRAHSPFLTRSLDHQPELDALLRAGDGPAAMEWAAQAGEGAGPVSPGDTGTALRRERLALATTLGVADLAGAIDVDTVMRVLSQFADHALDRAIAAAIAKRVPDAQPMGLAGIALGKHGAKELNYSSDIDPILLYDPDTLPRRDRDEPGEAAQRYARDIVTLLSDNTAEGYVFRVDLRLRPASEVSPLALSFDAALMHYESSALTWERAAYIRARAAAGDRAKGQDFLDTIAPFVWRRSLDFGTITEIEQLTAKIRAAYRGPSTPGPDYNVKQGRGGIREVEFFTQTHQLIHGGRDPSLRARGTKAALQALATANVIGRDDADTLGDAYDRLRTIEHRLQMVEDHQTHSLPSGTSLDNVAALAGYTDAAGLVSDLTDIADSVAARFDTLIEPDASDTRAYVSGDALVRDLTSLGFAMPDDLAQRIRSWTDGRYRALRSGAADQAFEAILPALLEALAGAPDPMRAVLRWENLLGNTTSAINLFRLLEARPGLFDQLVSVLTMADPLADDLGRTPALLDSLIDRSALDLPGSVPELIGDLTLRDTDYERQLDRIRIVTSERRFALGVQLIEAAHDPLAIAEGLSRLAEAGLHVAHHAAVEEFAQAHGRFAGGELVVLGLGRLGGGALTHRSDLDVVYMFAAGDAGESDGRRPLGTTLYYNRVAQRVSGALSVPTAHGALYEVDTRLRPQGAQGPLAVDIETFRRYQTEDAWTWEHMALTRARVLVGSDAARARIEGIVADVLQQHRDPHALRTDVLKMRADMAAHKPPRGPLDAKLLRGGLVDLEFLVHFLQLRDRIGLSPQVETALRALVDANLLSSELIDAHATMIRLLVSARLLAPQLQPPTPAACARLATACGFTDMDA